MIGDRRIVNFRNLLILPPGAHALGATAGQDLMRKVEADLQSATDEDFRLVLDLSSVSAVNGSFLKATVYWALQCGQAFVKDLKATSAAEWAVRPLRLYPVVLGCTGEVHEEVADFFQGRRLPILHFPKKSKNTSPHPEVLGELDPLLIKTLHLLGNAGEATAVQLAEKSEETISTSGWSNRLADLYLLRLVTRRREGKFWVYAPAIERISTHGT